MNFNFKDKEFYMLSFTVQAILIKTAKKLKKSTSVLAILIFFQKWQNTIFFKSIELS
jgi:hypothetical protein